MEVASNCLLAFLEVKSLFRSGGCGLRRRRGRNDLEMGGALSSHRSRD